MSIFGISTSQQVNKNYISPNGEYEIILKSKELGECRIELTYYLVPNNNDTLEFNKSVIRDLQPPTNIFTNDSKKLIFTNYEDEQGFKIKIMDLINKKIIFETNGFIFSNDQNKLKYYDSSNNILIYFNDPQDNDHKTIEVHRLNLKTLKTEILTKIETSGHSISKWPYIEEMNTESRLMTLKYQKITRTNSFYMETELINY